MAIIERGTGITRKRGLALGMDSNEQDVRDTAELAERNSSFKGWVAEVEERARVVMATAQYADGRALIAEADSAHDFASRVLWWIEHARALIEAGDTAAAAMAGVRIGMLVREHNMKVEHEPTWGSGDRYRRHGRSGRPSNTIRNTRLARQFQAEKARDPHQSDTAIMVRLGEAIGLRRSASIEAVKAGLKKISSG